MPHDPYSPNRPYLYECVQCCYRRQAERRPAPCPNCGERMQDLSVPRD